MGSYHSKHKDIDCPINYGYIESVMASDGEEQDAYILGVDKPVKKFIGKVITITYRFNNVEDKWVVYPENMTFNKAEIEEKVLFQEQFLIRKLFYKIKETMLCLNKTSMTTKCLSTDIIKYEKTKTMQTIYLKTGIILIAPLA